MKMKMKMKMKRAGFLSLIFSAVVLLSCATGHNTVSAQVDLLDFNFGTISNVMGYRGSPQLADMDVRIFDALFNTRLTMIGDREIRDLSDAERASLLLISYSATVNSSQAVVAINFVDYLTGRPVASARGQASNWWGVEPTINSALNRAITQVLKLFPN